MQYIEKAHTPPADWEAWFTTAAGHRAVDYGADYSSLTRIREARQYLLDEQHGLCAYCQREIGLHGSSIEHLIAKFYNKILSTNYHNLVAVCQDSVAIEGRKHCDKERLDLLIAPIILYENANVRLVREHRRDVWKNSHYFMAKNDGKIEPRQTSKERQTISDFIEILNLNHDSLCQARKNALRGILKACPTANPARKSFIQSQFDRIYYSPGEPFRQFLLIYFAEKLGIN